jgi:uncharacterized integral membrane protein (TIGR00697 family)
MTKATRLFIVLGGFFVANAIMAEFIGTKIFSLERTFGFQSVSWSFFGIGELSFELTAGVLLWPVVFVMTDIINEYFGRRGVRLLSFLAVGLISYAFVMVFAAIQLVPAEWWTSSGSDRGIPDLQSAYEGVFGQGLWIIFGSIIAFLIGQFIDVTIFHRIKRVTHEKSIWLRATGSTVVSQLIDSFVVLFVAFYIGADWSLSRVLAICAMNYLYKLVMAVALTPVIYLVHGWIDAYLGADAARMKSEAMEAA